MAAAREKRKTKLKKVSEGIVHINATFNNTMITITDLSGNVVSWSAAGKCGFKGSRKATPHAGQSAAEDALRVALDCGLRSAEVQVKGPGAGREQALRSVHNAGVRVTMIKDVSPLPHNGCRPPKKRRV